MDEQNRALYEDEPFFITHTQPETIIFVVTGKKHGGREEIMP